MAHGDNARKRLDGELISEHHARRSL